MRNTWTCLLCVIGGHMTHKQVSQSPKASVLKHLDTRLQLLVEGNVWNLSTSTRLQCHPSGIDPMRQQVAQQLTALLPEMWNFVLICYSSD